MDSDPHFLPFIHQRSPLLGCGGGSPDPEPLAGERAPPAGLGSLFFSSSLDRGALLAAVHKVEKTGLNRLGMHALSLKSGVQRSHWSNSRVKMLLILPLICARGAGSLGPEMK